MSAFLTGRNFGSKIQTSDIADDAITLAKLANGTANQNIQYNASGVPVDVALPDSGKVLQVIQTVKKDTTSTTSATAAAISGMTASLTCSSTSNKVLINFNTNIGGTANHYGVIQLFIGGSVSSFIPDAASSRMLGSSGNLTVSNNTVDLNNFTGSFLHSPSSTSEIAYALYWRRGAESTTLYLNRSGNDGDNANHSRSVSSITLMEIAG